VLAWSELAAWVMSRCSGDAHSAVRALWRSPTAPARMRKHSWHACSLLCSQVSLFAVLLLFLFPSLYHVLSSLFSSLALFLCPLFIFFLSFLSASCLFFFPSFFQLGATDFCLTSDEKQLKALKGTLDMIIDTACAGVCVLEFQRREMQREHKGRANETNSHAKGTREERKQDNNKQKAGKAFLILFSSTWTFFLVLLFASALSYHLIWFCVRFTSVSCLLSLFLSLYL
jgi:hypothetical protein